MIFLALSSSGDYAFYDSDLGTVPEQKVELPEETYRKLLLAGAHGAKLSVRDGAAVALDSHGNTVDLDNITAGSFYGEAPSLKDQANSALQRARNYVQNNYALLNEATPAAWVAYLRALMDISSGKDTESTSLPEAPAQ